MNLGLPILENIRLATKYPRSVHNKSDSIIDLIISKKLYILDFTETWPSPHDTTSCISDISPPFTTNDVILDVEMVLAFWYPIHLK